MHKRSSIWDNTDKTSKCNDYAAQYKLLNQCSFTNVIQKYCINFCMESITMPFMTLEIGENPKEKHSIKQLRLTTIRWFYKKCLKIKSTTYITDREKLNDRQS